MSATHAIPADRSAVAEAVHYALLCLRRIVDDRVFALKSKVYGALSALFPEPVLLSLNLEALDSLKNNERIAEIFVGSAFDLQNSLDSKEFTRVVVEKLHSRLRARNENPRRLLGVVFRVRKSQAPELKEQIDTAMKKLRGLSPWVKGGWYLVEDPDLNYEEINRQLDEIVGPGEVSVEEVDAALRTWSASKAR